jgi:hypothetical protein
MTTMDSQLDEFLGRSVPTSSAGWHHFGLIENPFPSRAHPVWEVFHNQAQLRDRFYRDLTVFIREGTTTTLFFTGGNRIGKTHFCEHHRMMLPASLTSRGLLVPIANVSAESCKFSELYRPIVDQIDDSLKLQTGEGLFARSWNDQLSRIMTTLKPGDFRQAVGALSATSADEAFASTRSILMQWLRGERIRLPQRRSLDVAGVIDALANQINALQGLVDTLRHLEYAESKKCPGIILFVDEFELIWMHRRDQRDRFLHALRALVDACPMGLLLCVAMATGGSYEHRPEDVESEYPALFARLKGVQEVPTLVEIPGVIEAQEYADAFLKHGRGKAQAANVAEGSALFSPADIRSLFVEVAGQRGGSVSQGDFFDHLHNTAERKLAVLTQR